MTDEADIAVRRTPDQAVRHEPEQPLCAGAIGTKAKTIQVGPGGNPRLIAESGHHQMPGAHLKEGLRNEPSGTGPVRGRRGSARWSRRQWRHGSPEPDSDRYDYARALVWVDRSNRAHNEQGVRRVRSALPARADLAYRSGKPGCRPDPAGSDSRRSDGNAATAMR